MSVCKNSFHQFYEENIEMLLTYNPKEYGINEENFEIWINRQETKELKKLSKLFKKYTRYVSYDEFLTKIKNICKDIINNKNNYNNFVLYVKYDTKDIKKNMIKSNFWITLLHYHFLHKELGKKLDIYIDIEEFSNINLELYKQKDKKILLIICDDASYSGEQIRIIFRELLLKEKIDKDNYFLFSIPYISNFSLFTIKEMFKDMEFKNEQLNLSDETEKFYGFREELEKKVENKKLLEYAKNKINIERHTIFFNHKLPDRVSIFQDIYAFGTSFFGTLKSDEKSISLIKGCDMTNLYNKWKDLTMTEKIDIQSIDMNAMCPEPFYKKFKYTGNIVDIEELRQLNVELKKLTIDIVKPITQEYLTKHSNKKISLYDTEQDDEITGINLDDI